jgi:hypothetical protein
MDILYNSFSLVKLCFSLLYFFLRQVRQGTRLVNLYASYREHLAHLISSVEPPPTIELAYWLIFRIHQKFPLGGVWTLIALFQQFFFLLVSHNFV